MIRAAAGHVFALAMLAQLLFATPGAAAPPLTREQITRLETARDGFDYREEAFFALVDNLAAWDGVVGDTPVRLHLDIDALLADPASHRGAFCRITGRLEQHHPLPPPYDHAVEWFVRDADGRPLLVYVVGLKDSGAVVRAGTRVELWGRFYKSIRFTARDGVERRYAAFVAAHPRRVFAATARTEHTRLWLMAGPIAALLIAFAAILTYARRQRRGGPSAGQVGRPDLHDLAARLDEAGPLPDDPAEALAELQRRAAALSDESTDLPPDADAVRSTR